MDTRKTDNDDNQSTYKINHSLHGYKKNNESQLGFVLTKSFRPKDPEIVKLEETILEKNKIIAQLCELSEKQAMEITKLQKFIDKMKNRHDIDLVLKEMQISMQDEIKQTDRWLKKSS